jgi:hypothetical protein
MCNLNNNNNNNNNNNRIHLSPKDLLSLMTSIPRTGPVMYVTDLLSEENNGKPTWEEVGSNVTLAS